ncbi:hypothetical protein [Amycolatopsis cihanbeyliensis]|uniref:Uncharacterized protein n=1 Tax=Amycolatopsis cihanbeyliensis TaxID=1128664 RepID=A0A542DKB9_AMYCI|nr:hypothetical protein [Amycolatopsis cihanbeyliensis]TQJ03551.1 hypothetical protein FB471_3313 [Amycolatopsis cihanbeyliensis]
MTSSSTVSSVSAPADTEAALRRLINSGYRFVHPRDADGEIVAVVGVRAHHTVVDVVRLDAEDEVTAARVPGDEENVLEPVTVLWRSSGAVGDVVGELLALADEDHAAPRPQWATSATAAATKGCWVAGQAGRTKWLVASA